MADPNDTIRRLEQILASKRPDFASSVEFVNSVVEDLQLEPGSAVLDLGTGWGIMSITLAAHGYRVLTGQPSTDQGHVHDHHAHDHHAHQDHHHQGHTENGDDHLGPMNFDYDFEQTLADVGLSDRVEVRTLDATDLDLSSSSQHAVFMYDVLHHIEQRQQAVDEVLRVLEPGGLFCVIEMNDVARAQMKEQMGFEPDPVDPREFVPEPTSVEIVMGEMQVAYLLRI